MKKFKITDVLIGAVFTVFFICLGVVTVLQLRFIYYLDIALLGIHKSTGLTREVIMENYNALMDYCSPFYKGDLVFPSLPASETGLIHFREVKEIFNMIYLLLPITFIILLAVIIYKHKKQDFSYLFTSSVTCIVLPAVVGLACLINFDKAFVLFHKLFFNNDYWIFDATTDPIITLLPESFFLQCAIIIIFIVLVGSLALYLTSNAKKGRYNRKKRLFTNMK